MSTRVQVGQRYGKLIVISEAPAKRNRRTWLCECDCGKKHIVVGSNLISKYNNTASCGCTKHRTGKDNPKFNGCGEIHGATWASIKANAKSRNIIFDLDINYAWNIFIQQNRSCAISGVLISFPKIAGKNLKTYTASLDRIDNSKGYIEGNVHWVHKAVNLMKLDNTLEDFIKICGLIYLNNQQRYNDIEFDLIEFGNFSKG